MMRLLLFISAVFLYTAVCLPCSAQVSPSVPSPSEVEDVNTSNSVAPAVAPLAPVATGSAPQVPAIEVAPVEGPSSLPDSANRPPYDPIAESPAKMP